MTTAVRPVSGPSAVPNASRHRVSRSRVFLALLQRDLRVARKELPFFLIRTSLQPLLFIIVFGYLLPKMGFMAGSYTSALLPGILAVSLTFSSVQSVALPLVQDFGWTKEIEDRLLAPVPTRLIAAEKIVAGVIQGFISAAFVMPIARLIMGPIAGLSLSNFPLVLLVVLLGATAFSSMGLLLGTAIEPQQIGLMFSVIIAPMIFFGCAYYPWAGLSTVPVMKYAVLVNPLVYVAEGLRAALTPSITHMPMIASTAALVFLSILFWTLGIRAFEKRAIG